MDPRLLGTLSLVLALAGIGGAFRACGSIAARGGATAARSATRIPPHVLRQLARTPPRAPIVIPGASGRVAGENALRAGAAGQVAAGVGDDAARLGARGAGRARPSGAVKQGAGNLDNLADVVSPDRDDPPDRRPQPRPRKR
jgi:hypothetical protein